jgi:antitoxin HicB
MRYPVKLTYQAAGNYSVRFPDIPEALTLGDTEEEALHHAADALETALDFYFDNKRLIPGPSLPKRGHKIVELPPSLSAKVERFAAGDDPDIESSPHYEDRQHRSRAGNAGEAIGNAGAVGSAV